MGLFTNKPQTTDSTPLFSTSLGNTMLLVGLGNPGAEYDQTRHNIGFAAIDAFVEQSSEFGGWVNKKDLQCLLATAQMGQNRVIAIKPMTFMNNSGTSAQAVCNFYKIPPAAVAVLHDELDIEYGQIRLRVGGSAAGHNGIKSVSQHIGEDYGRIRIGIGPKTPTQIDSADFVLKKFSAAQQGTMNDLCRETTAILTEYIYGGQLPNETRSFII